jgi:hypothetical protein
MASRGLVLVALGVAAGRVLPARGIIWARQLVGIARYSAPHVHFEVHPGGPGSSPVNPSADVRRACP